jgi:hypothetical protein
MAIITPLKTAAEQQLALQFANVKAELPGAGAVRKLREDAFAGFEAKGLPHRRLESWRYTDLRTLLREAMPLARKSERSPTGWRCRPSPARGSSPSTASSARPIPTSPACRPVSPSAAWPRR